MSDKMPAPRVEVILFRGKNGGFATREHDLGRVQLIAPHLDVKDVMPWNESWGFSESRALEFGKEWATFLGWPMVVLREHREVQVATTRVVEHLIDVPDSFKEV